MTKYFITQFNIAQSKAAMNSNIMAGFVARLDEINALADNSPGFIWRLQTEQGDATGIQAFENPLLLINMSVWKDIDSLRNFVYKTTHVELLQNKRQWFDQMQSKNQTLWWIPENHIPTVEEGKTKLELLRKNGPTADAFSFSKVFDSPLS